MTTPNGYRIGIDLGTSNSVVAYTRAGVQVCARLDRSSRMTAAAVFPSCVGMLGDRLIFGTEAMNSPDRVSGFKRGIGRGLSYRLGNRKPMDSMTLSAMLLREMKAAFEAKIGAIEGAVITVPANYNDRQRAEVMEAGRAAGLSVLRIINEPSAAAIGYSRAGHKLGENVLVVDWGGGTLDVSLVDAVSNVLDVKANDGDGWCGGNDIDKTIFDLVLSRSAPPLREKTQDDVFRNGLMSQCEKIKIWLSDNDVYDDPFFVRDSVGAAVAVAARVTRLELEQSCIPIIERVFAAVLRCMHKNPEGPIRPEEVGDVILVGGSCLLPMLRRRVVEYFGKPGRVDENPLEVVALGVAYQALHTESAGPLIMLHSLTKHLGVSAVSQDRHGVERSDTFVPIISAPAKIPARGYHDFCTLYDNQDRIDVKVFEADDGAVSTRGMVPITSREICDLPKSPAGAYPIRIRLEYDINQRVNVKVELPNHGRTEEWTADYVRELQSVRTSTDAILKELSQPATTGLAAFAQRVRTAISNRKASTRVRGLLDQLEQAIQLGEAGPAEVLRRQLSESLFDEGIQL
jgi:molecular chaperone DnaK (HSP70)